MLTSEHKTTCPVWDFYNPLSCNADSTYHTTIRRPMRNVSLSLHVQTHGIYRITIACLHTKATPLPVKAVNEFMYFSGTSSQCEMREKSVRKGPVSPSLQYLPLVYTVTPLLTDAQTVGTQRMTGRCPFTG